MKFRKKKTIKVPTTAYTVEATLEHDGKTYVVNESCNIPATYEYDAERDEFRGEGDDRHWSESEGYFWNEGNFGCDCNRSLRIGQQCDPDVQKLPCGDTIKLKKLIVRHNGKMYDLTDWGRE